MNKTAILKKIKTGLKVFFILAGAGLLAILAYSFYIFNLEKFIPVLETTVFTTQQFTAGSKASMRVLTLSRGTPEPIAGADVSIHLKEDASKKETLLYKGKTGATGSLSCRFDVPGDFLGECTMALFTTSAQGKTTVTIPVSVQKDTRIFLTSDKDLYSPGQSMIIRAAAFQQNNRVLQNEKISITVSEPQGYKVFQKQLKTCDYGIAEATFQLGGEVTKGQYAIKAQMGSYSVEKKVTVKDYALPKFKLLCQTDKPWYMPGQTVTGTVNAAYFYGKPISGGTVKVQVFEQVSGRTTLLATFKGTTDASGFFRFKYPIPPFSKDYNGKPIRRVETPPQIAVQVTDKSGHTENVTRPITLSAEEITIDVLPAYGLIKKNLENTIYVVTSYPGGSPAQCKVHVNSSRRGSKEKKGLQYKTAFQTNRWGIGEFRISGEALNKNGVNFAIHAEDEAGAEGRVSEYLHVDSREFVVTLKTEKHLCNQGEEVKLTVLTPGAGSDPVYLEAVSKGQIRWTRDLRLTDGEGETHLDLTDVEPGILDIYARKTAPEPEYAAIFDHWEREETQFSWDSVKLLVLPGETGSLQVTIKKDKKQYAPGQTARFDFVTQRKGKPVPAALGVTILDEALLAYAPSSDFRRFQNFCFNLDEESRKRKRFKGVFTIGDIIENEMYREQHITQEAKEKLAAVAAVAKGPRYYRIKGLMGISQFSSTGRQMEAINKRKSAHFMFLGRLFIPVIIVLLLVIAYFLFKFLLTSHEGGKKRFFLDLVIAGGFLVFQYLLLNTRIVLKGERLFPKYISFAFGVEPVLALFALLAAAMLIHAAYLHRKKDFTGFYIASLFSILSFQILFLVAIDRPYRYRLNAVPIIVLFLVGAAVAFIGFMVSVFRRKEKHIWKTVLLFFAFPFLVELLRLFSYFALFMSKDIDDYLWLPGLMAIFVLLVLSLYALRFIRSRDKRAIALTLFIVALCILVSRGSIHNYLFEDYYGSYSVSGSGGISSTPYGNWGASVLPSPNDMIYMKHGNAEESHRESDGKKSQDASKGKSQAIVLRQFFPETLYTNPRVITGQNGQASISVKMADSITQWKLSALAHTPDGVMGKGNSRVKVFKDFFVDAHLPKRLTQGDEIAVPTAIYNYLPRSRQVRVELEKNNGFRLLGESSRTVTVNAGDISVVYFRIRALKHGTFRLIFKARGPSLSDALVRHVTVIPQGKKIVQSFSGELKGTLRHTLNIPAEAVKNSKKLLVKLSPVLFAEVTEGLESMLTMPQGCFEQTASTTYPNVMVLDYLRKAGGLTPEIEKKAFSYIDKGYQKCLSYRTGDGGFSLYGEGSGDVFLTAYGLMLFTDMARVYPIDGALISDLQEWLIAKLTPGVNYGTYCGGAFYFSGKNVLVARAFIGWVLLRSGMDKNHPQIQLLLDDIEKSTSGFMGRPAHMSMAALTLLRGGRNGDVFIQALGRSAKRSSEGICWNYSLSEGDLNQRRGHTGTTALALLAMFDSPKPPLDVSRGIGYLMKRKNAKGYWQSTHTTVWVLRTLIKHLEKSVGTAPRKIEVKLGNRKVGELVIDEQNKGIMHTLDLSNLARRGDAQLSISRDGSGTSFVQIVSSYYLKWENPLLKKSLSQRPPIHLDLSYQTGKVKREVTVTVSAKYIGGGEIGNAIIDLGIPPGFMVYPGDLEKIKEDWNIRRYETDGSRIILYINDLDNKGETFTYRMRAQTAGRVEMPASVIYDYYDPGMRNVVRPVIFQVSKDSIMKPQ